MEILKIFIKIVLFLIGASFLVSGLLCGTMGLGSGVGGIVSLIGIAFAALGGYLLAYVCGLLDKKKRPAPANASDGSGDAASPPKKAERAEP